MQPGRMRHLIQIQSNTPTKGATGQDIDNWATVLSCWALIEPLTDKQLLVSQQIKATVSHRITIRYTTAITAASRIIYNNRVFDVVAYRNIEERNREIQVDCQEQE